MTVLRPTIALAPKDLSAHIDQGWQAVLRQAERLGLYRRDTGEGVVRLDRDGEGPTRVAAVELPAMMEYLSRAARWARVSISPDGAARTRDDYPPRQVASAMLATPDQRLRPLRRIVTHPIYALQGLRLVSARGYDAQSGLYLDLLSDAPDLVLEHPTDDDVAGARTLLCEEFLGDFPFADEASLAHAVAALLTPTVRDLIRGPVPCVFIDAPRQGTGKSLMAESIAIAATGRAPGMQSKVDTDDEWRKKLTSLIQDGWEVVLLDNLKGYIESSALAAALTGGVWADRLLGGNKMIHLPITQTWLATGNNVELDADLARRCVMCRLNAKAEIPSERPLGSFHHVPLQAWVRSNQSGLTSAILTLVNAWIAAGCPAPQRVTTMLGSYESWWYVIGGILETAGIPGFLGNRGATLTDQESHEWRTLVELWWEQQRHGGQPVEVGGLLQLVLKAQILPAVTRRTTEQAQIAALGRALQERIGQVYHDMEIVAETKDPRTRRARYALRPVESQQPAAERGAGINGEALRRELRRAAGLPVADAEADPGADW